MVLSEVRPMHVVSKCETKIRSLIIIEENKLEMDNKQHRNQEMCSQLLVFQKLDRDCNKVHTCPAVSEVGFGNEYKINK